MRWSDWSWNDPASYAPTYGNYGGPGWTAGSRSGNGTAAPMDDLDEVFKDHDDAYEEAKKLAAANSNFDETAARIAADIELVESLEDFDWKNSNVDPDQIIAAKVYAELATAYFSNKALGYQVYSDAKALVGAVGDAIGAIADAVVTVADVVTETVSKAVSIVSDFVSGIASAVSDFISGKKDDLASAQAPESLDAEIDGQEELENEQNNAEQTQDDIEQAQQGDDLNDQKAAEPPPPSGDEGGGPDSPPSYSPPSKDDDSYDGSDEGWYPIALDLNQNGEIELTALDQSNAFYDFDGDEYLNRVGWVSGDDGFLAIDIGGDGIIELGSEIAFADFGRYAVGQLELAEEVEAYLAEHGLLNENLDFNGDGVVDVADFDSDRNGLISDLEGLRYFDSNADGVIDSGDAVWSHLRVWQDYDQDGTSDAGEVSTLDGLGDASLNIASISLVSDANKVEGGEYGEGNVVYGLGSYTTADGGSSILGDVAFSASNIGYKEDADGTVRMKYDDVETVYRDDSGGYFELS